MKDYLQFGGIKEYYMNSQYLQIEKRTEGERRVNLYGRIPLRLPSY